MRIFLAGHKGMVGSAIWRKLVADGVDPAEILTAGRDELDLSDQRAVRDYLARMRPDAVVIAAAKVGGIHANNTYPADFIYENLIVECNLVEASFRAGVEKLLFLGSSCIYPKDAPQPIPETALMTGPLEPTNEPYAVAKIAGIKLCESYNRQHGVDYRSVMPTNLYGPGDNFHPENAHVVPALMRRFHEAVRDGTKEVVIWGSGRPMREFLHVDDMADASLFVLNLAPEEYARETDPRCSHINVGTGEDITIANLVEILARVAGFDGRISYDKTKPDGTMRKLLDVSKLARMGWHAQIPLERGLRETYAWYRENGAPSWRV